MKAWDLSKSRDLYNIEHWGGGYFDINASGHLVVRPLRGEGNGPGIDLFELTGLLRESGLRLPILVRFPDILRDRLEHLRSAFAHAMQAQGYSGGYTPVYPIKVNQQRSVVETILQYNGGRIGLEAGSKPELIAVLSLLRGNDAIVVCNGYKDREYVRLALIGRRLGYRVFIVVEKMSELELVLSQAKNLGVDPLIGLRVRLASIAAGKWQNTGGEKAKFGLSSSQVLAVAARLREVGMLDALQLLHVHVGSQVSNIRDIQTALREAARFYSELLRLGVPIAYFDVGGGLGIDYEGTRSRSVCSMNYSIHEYARQVVGAIADVCAEQDLPHPQIITESGRAMTAHHALLITEVIDVEQVPGNGSELSAVDDEAIALQHLRQTLEKLHSCSPLEAYHDAGYWLTEAYSLYSQGGLSLAARARAEQLYYSICRGIAPELDVTSRSHREVLDELNNKLADKYFCNFSVFQSIPDVWAIDQVFPIVPLHRLNECPDRRGVIEDLTCDSDGRVDNYAGRRGVMSTLPLHSRDKVNPYMLGIFLVGAYQEILGDIHNLFGDTDAVNIELAKDGTARIVSPSPGDKVESVLRTVGFDAGDVAEAFRNAIAASAHVEAEGQRLLDELIAGIDGYTYLED